MVPGVSGYLQILACSRLLKICNDSNLSKAALSARCLTCTCILHCESGFENCYASVENGITSHGSCIATAFERGSIETGAQP